MLKISAIVALMFVVSSVWSACDSCGSECASACGTRRFRACCFNYLRKKRGPEFLKVYTLAQEEESQSRSKPLLTVSNLPISEQWISKGLSSENYPYSPEVMLDNQLY